MFLSANRSPLRRNMRYRSPARYSAQAATSSGEIASIRSDMPGLLPRLLEIFAGLARHPRLGAFAQVAGLVAAGASDRDVGPHRLRRDVGRGRRLLQVGPSLLREIARKRHHVVALHGLGERRHDVVLARAALVVAQLQIGVAQVLAPDYRRGLLLRDAVLAVAGRAELRLVLDRLRARRRRHRNRQKRGHERKRPRPSRLAGKDVRRRAVCRLQVRAHVAARRSLIMAHAFHRVGQKRRGPQAPSR